MTDLIFLSLENWDDHWRRNQFVCAELARRHPDKQILFVALPRDVSNRLRRAKFSELIRKTTYRAPGFDNITITHPLKLFPNSLPLGRRWNDRLYRRHIRRLARQLKLNSPLLWINAHWAHHCVGRLHESAVVYDITDDWTTITQSASMRRLTLEQDNSLVQSADAVIVCSQQLYDLKKSFCTYLYTIPNGVDADHYKKVLDGPSFPLPIANLWQHPILGYTGTIHPDRVDVDLLSSLSENFPGATLVLVGPNHLSPGDMAKLDRPNVVFTGPVPYDDIPRFMQHFDVSIAPHRVTPFTESLNPIKLWEYLAAGKPIVSTPIAGFRDYPAWVRLASDAPTFLAAIKDALTEDRATQIQRRLEVQSHSWKSRVDSIENVIKGVEYRRIRPITAMARQPVQQQQ